MQTQGIHIMPGMHGSEDEAHLFVSMMPATLSILAVKRPATMNSASSRSRKSVLTPKLAAIESIVTLLYESRNCRRANQLNRGAVHGNGPAGAAMLDPRSVRRGPMSPGVPQVLTQTVVVSSPKRTQCDLPGSCIGVSTGADRQQHSGIQRSCSASECRLPICCPASG